MRAARHDCMRWDTGADNLEVLTNIIDNYNNYHPVNDFRRGRLTFGCATRSHGLLTECLVALYARISFWYSMRLRRASAGMAVSRVAIRPFWQLSTLLTSSAVLDPTSVGTYAYSERDGLLLNFDTQSQGVGPDGLSSRAREWDFDGNIFTLDLSRARYQFDQFVENEERERPYYFHL